MSTACCAVVAFSRKACALTPTALAILAAFSAVVCKSFMAVITCFMVSSPSSGAEVKI